MTDERIWEYASEEELYRDERDSMVNEIESLSHEELKARAIKIYDSYAGKLRFIEDLLTRDYQIEERQRHLLAAYLGITENVKNYDVADRVNFYLDVAQKALNIMETDEQAMRLFAKEDPGAYALMLLSRRKAARTDYGQKCYGWYLKNRLVDVINDYDKYDTPRATLMGRSALKTAREWVAAYNGGTKTPSDNYAPDDFKREYTAWFTFTETTYISGSPFRASMTFDDYSAALKRSQAKYG